MFATRLFFCVLVICLFGAHVTRGEQWKELAGVAVDEGNDIGDFKGCDLDCCKQKCDSNAACNSFAATSRNCYLKDKCIFSDSPAKRSAYKTYYRPCPDVGIIESTCGVWTDLLAKAKGFRGNVSEAVIAFSQWQNCVVAAAAQGQVRHASIFKKILRSSGYV